MTTAAGTVPRGRKPTPAGVMPRSYAALLTKFQPSVIHTNVALQSAYCVIEALMSERKPSEGQLQFLELLSTLVEQYEAKKFPTPSRSLAEILRHLLDAKGVKKADVARDVGINRSVLSDVMAGRRNLSTANMKRLADYFCVEPGLFLNATP